MNPTKTKDLPKGRRILTGEDAPNLLTGGYVSEGILKKVFSSIDRFSSIGPMGGSEHEIR